ncbi:MAG: hypothetical protein MUO58_11920 [Anaerolineales bacterium]|nr:hypothetical protein [Anaerolineales bacterium]
MRRLLLVSSNPLFVEVVSEPFEDCPEMELHAVRPEEAIDVAKQIQPSTILIDDRISDEAVNSLIMLEQGPALVRILLISVESNDIVVLSKNKETIARAEDLIRLIAQ